MSNFKEEYLKGKISFDSLNEWVAEWHTKNIPGELQDHLGFTEKEMDLSMTKPDELKKFLDFGKVVIDAKLNYLKGQ